ncbi:MAG: asparagine synthase (glutamine-hydrolyzing) [Steroidobacteraceae bacterium]
MCGICGQFAFAEGGAPVAEQTVRAMSDTIRHRGPDDDGFHLDGTLGLGFRRLSIIDLAGGHQPMSDEAETIWVVFNGEIYNFQELRAELQGYGHVFRTLSDTEVIIHGYKQWGCGILARLNGMFGLAIWDVARRRLTLARDAAGIKLVYYRVNDGVVTFGSELRAVLRPLGETPPIDRTALNLFLRYRYTPSPLTLYEGIRKLAPGTMAVFDSSGWRVERWLPATGGTLTANRTDDDVVEELLEIYTRAVRRHLMADVPVGLLLSGGIDSGLLLALMNLCGSDWPTYSVGYGKAAYDDDELEDAAATARMMSARHFPVQIEQAEFERVIQDIVSIVEEPVAASSIVPMYFVCRRARQDVKVALMGQGPDELFGGYPRHLGVEYGGAWRAIPSALRVPVEQVLKRVPRGEAVKRALYSLGTDDRMTRYQNVFSILPGPTVDGLFRPEQVPVGAGDEVLKLWENLRPEIEASDELGGLQVLELASSLPDELLMYADKLSMIHSLEVRVPYLDREVVAFAQRLPARFKIRYGERKWAHRRVCRKLLPPDILRRKKRGFAVDAVDKWFRGSLGDRFDAYLCDPGSRMFEYLDPMTVGNLLSEHRAGREDNHKALFSLVVLEEWLRASCR